jgi:dienelactone hydrolase
VNKIPRLFGLPLFLLMVLVLAGCGGSGGSSKGSSTGSETKHASVFDYDSSAPLRFVDRRVLNPGRKYPIKIHDISYAGWKGRQVNALLVVPPGKGPFAAVVYQHGSGASRIEFVVEAAKLARKGAVGLLVDAPWVRSEVPYTGSVAIAVRDQYIGNIVDIRRGLDLLAHRDDVAMDRVGFFGGSYGGQIGGILAGVEPRFRALDIFSAAGQPSKSLAEQLRTGPRGQKILSAIDPVNYVSTTAPRELFIQAGHADLAVSPEQLTALMRAASEPKQVKWYPTGHALSQAAFNEGEKWLAKQLELSG